MATTSLWRRHRLGPACHCLALLWMLWSMAFTATLGQLAHGRFQFGEAVYATNEAFGVAVVTVQRHLGSDGRAAVYVSTMTTGGGNAVVGRDFRGVNNQSLIWQDGDDLDKQLYVRVLNDAIPQEANKTFTLYLHDANGADLNADRSQTQVVLVPPTNLVSGSFRLLTAALTTFEGSLLEIPVVWEGGTTSSARLAYEIQCGSACDTSGDFTVVSPPILTWTRGGNTTQVIQIEINDDGIFEQSETFRVALLAPRLLDPVAPDPVHDPSSVFTLAPAALGNLTQTDITIQGPNNVHTGIAQFETLCFPACPATSYSVMDCGVVRAYVQRRNGSDGALQARVISVDGTAQSGIDFKPVNQTIQWADGDASTQFVLVETLNGVVRTTSNQFTLALVEVQGSSGGVAIAAPSSSVAATTTIMINAPSNIVPSQVNFFQPSLLKPVLRYPDESFLRLVTRFDSGFRVCPGIVVRRPGDVVLYLRRAFGTIDHNAASVVIKTVGDSAVDGNDFVGFPADGIKVAWAERDTQSTVKTVTISIPEPTEYYTERRSFFVTIDSVTGIALGLCNMVEIVLDSVSRPPRISSFDLDMNAGILTLRTTSAVLPPTFDAAAVSLQSDAVGSVPTERFRLGPQSTASSVDGTTIVVTLSQSDLNGLKRSQALAKSGATTFLSALPGAFDYVLENCIARGFQACAHAKLDGILTTSAMAVTTFTPDTTQPVLLGFTMDVGLRLVKLRFSEPVDRLSVRISSLGFAETQNAIDVYYLSSHSSKVFWPNPNPLSGVLQGDANPLPPDATYLTIQLGVGDLAAIRAIGGGQIGLQATSTFLTIDSTFVADFSSPPNPAVAIPPPTLAMPALRLLRVAAADCSPCPTGLFLRSSCSAMQHRVCQACTVCPMNSFALTTCSPVQDTVCYPCTDCIGGRYTASECSATADRVCATCTRCTSDEYESSPCASQQDRVCRTCDSCTLTSDQKRLCGKSNRWRRRQMKQPYGCPAAGQSFQTLEAQLQRSKSNRCGAGRCSCTGNTPGNANPNGDSFADDPRCTGPEVFGVDL